MFASTFLEDFYFKIGTLLHTSMAYKVPFQRNLTLTSKLRNLVLDLYLVANNGHWPHFLKI